MFDHARDAAQGVGETRRVGNFAESAIEDVVAFVGDVGVAVSVGAKGDLRAEGFDLRLDERLRERNYFDGKRKPTEMFHLLA